MKNKFKYTVREYNEDRNSIIVDFDDGSWAEIRLENNGRFPTSPAEIDDLVKPYATHLDNLEAKEMALKSDKDYIRSLIGKDRTTERFSQRAKNEPTIIEEEEEEVIDTTPQFTEDQLDNLNMAEREFVKSIVMEVLEELGIK